MEEKIRLAVFGQKRLSREGGIEIVVKELCTRMAQNGCDVTCYNRAGHHVSGAEYDKTIEYDGMEDNQAKCEGAGRSNVCVSYHALSEDWSEIADRTINMLEKIIENEAVHAMLAVLTDKQRDLIHQQFVLGKTHQEIADDMGISRGSVTRAVNQALERIRRKFDFEAHYELAAGGLA